MAVSDNLGLYLPTREDYVSVKRDISDNFEEVDDFAGGVMNGLAIVADGDTHIAIASGQYVYIRNNPNGVSEGMYTANSAISANASIYPANVTVVSGGISNALNGKILEKTAFVDLGNKTGMKNVWDALTIYDKAVIGQYNNGGVRVFLAYKYTGSQYGFMLQLRWGSNNIDTMTVTDGVETIKTIYAS